MENKASWHHHLPTAEEFAAIRADFAKRKEAF
jgi:transketolase